MWATVFIGSHQTIMFAYKSIKNLIFKPIVKLNTVITYKVMAIT